MSALRTPEHSRLEEARTGRVKWRRWGPYVSDRAWGTVREDYSKSGDAWEYLSHDHARSKAYRWGEDGIAGVCDRDQTLCLGLSLWNGRDPILKERLFGLTGNQGNHGEDVKEIYYHLAATPTSSYLQFLYKYPQSEFPYAQLIEENARRKGEPGEFELMDTGVFDDDRYFDVFVEYAKESPDDIHCRITVHNRGPVEAPIHILPTLWFRNAWAWGSPSSPEPVPTIEVKGVCLQANHHKLGAWNLYFDGMPEALFTNNESNRERLYGAPNDSPFVKDAFHERIVNGKKTATNPKRTGTKAALWYQADIPAGGEATFHLRLTQSVSGGVERTEPLMAVRRAEWEAFYESIEGADLGDDERRIHRQACAGMLWSMQYYAYDVDVWLRGDRDDAPRERMHGRNRHWKHFNVADVISMPDKWEYPWFAAWDLAFHCVALANVDVELAKAQLKLMVKEWYQHPNGQIPAYEWEFSDLNPPVHAWATFQVYKKEARTTGRRDRVFLERIFHKLLINFAWWVNRKDSEGNNIFEGGFLGMDNISLFDRSERLPGGASLQQADATAWMAMYCLDLMRIALELAFENSAYEDMASKFFEHFLYIAYAINQGDASHPSLWDEQEGWYYDVITMPDGSTRPLRVASQVGLIPLVACHVLDASVFQKLPNFARRYAWFLDRHPELAANVITGSDGRATLSLLNKERLGRVLDRLLDEDRMLSPYGPRSLSREHAERPYRFDGMEVHYEPGEAETRIKGGNSNWRGPVWFPTGYLVIRALLRMQRCFGDDFRAPCPTRGGPLMTCGEIARELSARMVKLFEKDSRGFRPVHADRMRFQQDPNFRDYLWFHEYFHGDTGEGLGASHQTGWTGLAADLLIRVHARGKRSG